MGKGFNNYMCKKFFHPASRDNLKRVWMAEQQTESYKKKQEELRVQYEKEQDLYTNKAMTSKESKEKLSVNFLYEPPPGTKKDREREDDEPEFKFEWQRKYNAPRESYCKGDQEIRDQPFGIQVRNVRCIKCHKWGHINTDKECPMYNQSGAGAETGSNSNPSDLIRQMREDGLAMKKGAVGLLELPNCSSSISNQQLIPSSSEDEDHMNESELKFLEGLSTKKKLKLLRKLEKLEKRKKKKKLKKAKKGKKKEKMSDCESSASDSDSSSSHRKRKRAENEGTKNLRKSQNGQSSLQQTERKDLENDLYTVLGRKMDFEGPPQSSQKQQSVGSLNGNSSKERKKRSCSRSYSKGGNGSRTPPKDSKNKEKFYGSALDCKKGRNEDARDSSESYREKHCGSIESKSRYRQDSPSRDRSRHDQKIKRSSMKVRERSTSGDKSRR